MRGDEHDARQGADAFKGSAGERAIGEFDVERFLDRQHQIDRGQRGEADGEQVGFVTQLFDRNRQPAVRAQQFAHPIDNGAVAIARRHDPSPSGAIGRVVSAWTIVGIAHDDPLNAAPWKSCGQ